MRALEIAVGLEAAKALIVVGSICYGSRKGSGNDSFGQKGPAYIPIWVNVSGESRIAGGRRTHRVGSEGRVKKQRSLK